MGDFEFHAESWARMTTRDRVRLCQAFADQARKLSDDAAPDLKRSYLELSRRWLALAEEIEYHGSSPP